MKNEIIHPAQKLEGEPYIPGDKSISHRSIIFGSLATGKSKIKNLLLGEDVLGTMRIFQQMGVAMSHTPENLKSTDTLEIEGTGLHSLKKPDGILDCGNSGTTMRLLLGILSAQPFEAVLTGDDSLNKRPMERVIKPLAEMGAKFEIYFEGKKRFIKVTGNSGLNGINYNLPVASAQLKSALLLAGLYTKKPVTVTEPALSRDHTERMLIGLGASLTTSNLTTTLDKPESLKPFEMEVPADFSSAAFFIVAGLILPHSKILLKNIGINPTRSALLEVLQKMGGDIKIQNKRDCSGEPVADLFISSSNLKPTKVFGDIIPKLIDEIPILAVACARAHGTSEISDAEELRVKESDRISILAQELRKFGISITEKKDGFIVEGTSTFKSATFESFGDHRIAMSCAVGSLLADKQSEIKNVDCVATSFPGFFGELRKISS